MNAIVRVPLNSAAKAKAMKEVNDEIERQTVEARQKLRKEYEDYAYALDATVLWGLHVSKGYGKKQLRDVYEEIIRTRVAFRLFLRGGEGTYEEQPTGRNIEDFALTRFLADIGVDLKAWTTEEIHIDDETGEVAFYRKDQTSCLDTKGKTRS